MKKLTTDCECRDLIDVMSEITRQGKIGVVTVYKKPKDYPSKYVARVFYAEKGTVTATKHIKTATSLPGLRKKISSNLARLEPNPNDDPKIVEVYM